MSAGRTEPPTPRRLREARRRGEVARRAELSGAAALAAGLAALLATAPRIGAALAAAVRGGLAVAVAADADPVAVVRAGLADVARASAVPCLAALAGGAVAGALQVGLAFAPEALRPRLARVDPVRGLRRLLAPSRLVDVALGLAQAAAIVALVAAWARGLAGSVAALPRAGAPALWAVAPAFGGLAIRLAACAALAGAGAWALARRRHLRALRMTPDEVRRERRDDEGDPHVRGERRRLHRAALEAGPVARATCVVVNPTHVAVALRHDRFGDAAPRVLAKGTGDAAARIRSAARRAGVPVVRDVALARALFRLAEVGEEIPESLYDAAAAVLVHLYGLRPEASA